MDLVTHAASRPGQEAFMTVAGPGRPAQVEVFSVQSLALIDTFFAIAPSFPTGAFVGG